MATPNLEHSSLDGRYRLTRVLRETQESTLYEAEHLLVGRRVAVEVLAPELAQLPELRARFEEQARCLGRVTHPSLASVLDLGATGDGHCYVARELPPGESLAALIALGPVSVERALVLIEQVLAGLTAAHAAGVARLDLDPESIVVTELDPGRPQVKLQNFVTAAANDTRHLESHEVQAVARLFVQLLHATAYTELVSAELAAFLERALSPHPEQRPALADLRQLITRERELDLGISRLPSVRLSAAFAPSWPCSVPVAQFHIREHGGFWGISESMLVAPRIPPPANTPKLDPKLSPVPVEIAAPPRKPAEGHGLRVALVFAGSAALGLLGSWMAGIL